MINTEEEEDLPGVEFNPQLRYKKTQLEFYKKDLPLDDLETAVHAAMKGVWKNLRKVVAVWLPPEGVNHVQVRRANAKLKCPDLSHPRRQTTQQKTCYV